MDGQHKFTPSNNPRHDCVRCPYSKPHAIHNSRAKRPRVAWKRIFNKPVRIYG